MQANVFLYYISLNIYIIITIFYEATIKKHFKWRIFYPS